MKHFLAESTVTLLCGLIFEGIPEGGEERALIKSGRYAYPDSAERNLLVDMVVLQTLPTRAFRPRTSVFLGSFLDGC